MKVEDFAYRVASRTIELLEFEQHYKVADDKRKAVLDKIRAETNDLLKQSM